MVTVKERLCRWPWGIGYVLGICCLYKLCALFSWGKSYCLQPHLWLYFCVWRGLCRPEVSLISVSNLILDFIHSEIVMIDLIPLFSRLYFIQVFLGPLETTINVMVAPIIMMMMFIASAVMNAGSRWEMAMMRLIVKTPSLIQCSPLPVGFH